MIVKCIVVGISAVAAGSALFFGVRYFMEHLTDDAFDFDEDDLYEIPMEGSDIQETK